MKASPQSELSRRYLYRFFWSSVKISYGGHCCSFAPEVIGGDHRICNGRSKLRPFYNQLTWCSHSWRNVCQVSWIHWHSPWVDEIRLRVAHRFSGYSGFSVSWAIIFGCLTSTVVKSNLSFFLFSRTLHYARLTPPRAIPFSCFLSQSSIASLTAADKSPFFPPFMDTIANRNLRSKSSGTRTNNLPNRVTRELNTTVHYSDI